MSKSYIVSGNQVKLSLQLVTKQLEAEANHLLAQAEVEILKLMQQGYSLPQAESIVMGWIQNNQGFAKAYWNRQNKLINELENKLVALPAHEYGDQHPDEKLRWVLGEVITHHCHDCLRLSKIEPMTIGEWRELETGLPGEGKTHCSFGCKCKLKPIKSINASVRMTNEEAIKEILKTTKNKIERGHCYKNGKIILSKNGDKNSISFTPAEEKLMLGSDLLMHNHPSSSSFSSADIGFILKNDIKEIWAIAPEAHFGNGYYSIKPTLPQGQTFEEFLPDFQHNVTKLNSEVENRFWKKINNNEISIDYANKMHHHELWKLVAKKYGWKYGFQQRN